MITGEIRPQVSLSDTFYMDLLKKQQEYNHNRDNSTMATLLASYTDCVAYFQAKQQPVSEYFQAKIKQVLKNVKYFTHTNVDLGNNRAKLNKDMYTIMETQIEKVQNDIDKDIQKHKNITARVSNILADQEAKVKERLLTCRRSTLSKNISQKNTLSFATVSSRKDYASNLAFDSKHKKNSSLQKVERNCSPEQDQIDKYFVQGAIITTNYSPPHKNAKRKH